jgi:hypothetical protein
MKETNRSLVNNQNLFLFIRLGKKTPIDAWVMFCGVSGSYLILSNIGLAQTVFSE